MSAGGSGTRMGQGDLGRKTKEQVKSMARIIVGLLHLIDLTEGVEQGGQIGAGHAEGQIPLLQGLGGAAVALFIEFAHAPQQPELPRLPHPPDGQGASLLAHLPCIPLELQNGLLVGRTRAFHPGPPVDQRDDVVCQTQTVCIRQSGIAAHGEIQSRGDLRVGEKTCGIELCLGHAQLLLFCLEIRIVSNRQGSDLIQCQTLFRVTL